MKEIEDIVRAYKAAELAGKQSALATVVHVEGSSYRRPGARMLVTEDGELTGAISGGCLEGDALRKALLAISQQQNKLVTYNTMDEDDLQFGVQLGCNGIVHILFEPIHAADTYHPIALLEKALLQRKESVAVTLFSLNQYTGPQPGTCLLYTDGSLFCKEPVSDLVPVLNRDVQEVLTTQSSTLKEYAYTDTTVTGLIEWLPPAISLVIVGAGNDAFPLVQMAHIAGWQTTVADGRPGHANRQRFPDAGRILTGKPPAILEQLPIDAQTAFVLMTHNYNYDVAMLEGLLPHDCGYIGVLGPGRKMERMLQELEEKGLMVDDAMRKRIYGPTGLDLGAETAAEIALSVMAEIKMVLSARAGLSLRDKKGGIHEQSTGTIPLSRETTYSTTGSCFIKENS
jgi:xanthine/CO dehydrogenase XdhC/CoxF family maturation factor